MSSIQYPSANNDPAALMIQKIDALYTSLANTPLHDAAAAGETLLAIEIATLEPSFARMLNGQGLSPMHLALINRHFETVRSLLAIEPELVRVKGKYRKTPLHYAAEMDETEILAEFLLYCPSAIKDLTSSCDSALHSAVKRRSVGACKVILGWLQKLQVSHLYTVVNWKDVNGNNVLHIAVATNQPEVMRMFIPYISMYSKNLQGKSYVDLGEHHPDKEIKKLLRNVPEGFRELSHAVYLSGGVNSCTRRFGAKLDHLCGSAVPMDLRNIYFVVTGLIVSVTYQAIMTTPQPQVQQQMDPTTAPAPAPAPAPIGSAAIPSIILAGNSVAFFVSLLCMIELVRRLPRPWSLYLSTSFVSLAIGYICSFLQNQPSKHMKMLSVGTMGIICLFITILEILQMRPRYSPMGYIRKLSGDTPLSEVQPGIYSDTLNA